MDMNLRNKKINKKSRREFVAGFTAGAICLGIVAIVLLIIFCL